LSEDNQFVFAVNAGSKDGTAWKEEIHTLEDRFVQEESAATLRLRRGNRRAAYIPTKR